MLLEGHHMLKRRGVRNIGKAGAVRGGWSEKARRVGGEEGRRGGGEEGRRGGGGGSWRRSDVGILVRASGGFRAPALLDEDLRALQAPGRRDTVAAEANVRRAAPRASTTANCFEHPCCQGLPQTAAAHRIRARRWGLHDLQRQRQRPWHRRRAPFVRRNRACWAQDGRRVLKGSSV